MCLLVTGTMLDAQHIKTVSISKRWGPCALPWAQCPVREDGLLSHPRLSEVHGSYHRSLGWVSACPSSVFRGAGTGLGAHHQLPKPDNAAAAKQGSHEPFLHKSVCFDASGRVKAIELTREASVAPGKLKLEKTSLSCFVIRSWG